MEVRFQFTGAQTRIGDVTIAEPSRFPHVPVPARHVQWRTGSGSDKPPAHDLPAMNYWTASVALLLAGCATAPAPVPVNEKPPTASREIEPVPDSTRKCADGERPRLLNQETLNRLIWDEASRAIQYGRIPPTGPFVAETIVHAFIDERGRIERTIVKTSSKLDFWDRAAVRAVGRGRFQPARCEGRPVALWIEMPVAFSRR